MNTTNETISQVKSSDAPLQLEYDGFKSHMKKIKDGIKQQTYLILNYKEMCDKYKVIEEQVIQMTKHVDNLTVKVNDFDRITKNNENLRAIVDKQSKNMEKLSTEYTENILKSDKKIESLKKHIELLSNTHNDAERLRVQAENKRVKAEESRANNEASRSNAEESRVKAEKSRTIQELAKETSEKQREANEVKRNLSEKKRAANEDQRLENEIERETISSTSNTVLEEKINEISERVQKMLDDASKQQLLKPQDISKSLEADSAKTVTGEVDINTNSLISEVKNDDISLQDDCLSVVVSRSENIANLIDLTPNISLSKVLFTEEPPISLLKELTEVLVEEYEPVRCDNTKDGEGFEASEGILDLPVLRANMIENQDIAGESNRSVAGLQAPTNENSLIEEEVETVRITSKISLSQSIPIIEKDQEPDVEVGTKPTELIETANKLEAKHEQIVLESKDNCESALHSAEAKKIVNTNLTNPESPNLDEDKSKFSTPSSKTLVDEVADSAGRSQKKAVEDTFIITNETSESTVEKDGETSNARPIQENDRKAINLQIKIIGATIIVMTYFHLHIRPFINSEKK